MPEEEKRKTEEPKKEGENPEKPTQQELEDFWNNK